VPLFHTIVDGFELLRHRFEESLWRQRGRIPPSEHRFRIQFLLYQVILDLPENSLRSIELVLLQNLARDSASGLHLQWRRIDHILAGWGYGFGPSVQLYVEFVCRKTHVNFSLLFE